MSKGNLGHRLVAVCAEIGNEGKGCTPCRYQPSHEKGYHMAFCIEVPGVTWETSAKGYMDVTLDDGQVVRKNYLRVAVPKASVKDDPGYVEVCTSDVPEHIYIDALQKGLQMQLNRGKALTSIKGTKTNASRAEAIKAVEVQLEAIYSGQLRVSAGARTAKEPAAVRTLAMQKARLLVRDALKRAGKKVTLYSAREITAAATIVLNGPKGAKLLADAAAELKARAEEESVIDVEMLQPDPEKVAASNAKRKRRPKDDGPKLTVEEMAGVQATSRSRPQPEARA